MEDDAIVAALPRHSHAMQSLLAVPHNPAEPLIEGVGERSFDIRAANSWGERGSASLLISRRYAGRGYASDPLPERADPNSLTLVATDHDQVIGTLTVRFDSEDLLLADESFRDELYALRKSGRQLCEFTKLAMDGLVRSQRVLAAMFHVAFIHAHRIRGCDSLLIEVNPRHTRYYETKLGFSKVGAQRLNRRVNAPAMLLALDLWYAQQRIAELGGRPTLAGSDRSLYPFAFSASEELGIIGRILKLRAGTCGKGLSDW